MIDIEYYEVRDESYKYGDLSSYSINNFLDFDDAKELFEKICKQRSQQFFMEPDDGDCIEGNFFYKKNSKDKWTYSIKIHKKRLLIK